MQGTNGAPEILCEAIRDGTFPESNDLLVSDLSPEAIPPLLETISAAQVELRNEIRAAIKDESGNVDEWIVQAKKIQMDIARCQLEAKQIVEEHQRVEALRVKALEHQGQVDFLEAEVRFSEALERELQTLATVTQSFREVEDDLFHNNACEAAQRLQRINEVSSGITGSRAKTLIREIESELRLKVGVHLEATLNSRIVVRREKDKSWLEVRPDDASTQSANTNTAVEALEQLGRSQDAVESVTDRIEAFILQPLRSSSRFHLVSHSVTSTRISVDLGMDNPPIGVVLDFVTNLLDFIHSAVPSKLQAALTATAVPKLVWLLTSDWLTPAIPTELAELSVLDDLRQHASQIVSQIESFEWPGSSELRDWIHQLPRAWLTKRKSKTLDDVRKAFARSPGLLRQVERVERQSVPVAGKPNAPVDTSSDWDAGWDEEVTEEAAVPQKSNSEDAENTSGWGFDDDDEGERGGGDGRVGSEEGRSGDKLDKNGDHGPVDDDEAADAWDWNDEIESPSNHDQKQTDPSIQPGRHARSDDTNGAPKTEQEITLTELYSVTEVPDHVIEIISNDLSDARAILETRHQSIDPVSSSKGLLALPTLALAMFRATAPTYYSISRTLSNMNLYNDSLNIAERLRDMQPPAGTGQPVNLESDCKAMEKFAKSAYAKEMETQRMILADLLDGAQGFTSSTQFPYAREIENAVSGVVERLRTLHKEWQPILSTSALLQSVGALLAVVISRIIADVEDMDDISEPESQRLASLLSQITALDDLFVSRPPPSSGTRPPNSHPDQDSASAPVPMTAVYVSNWLKFQYLLTILESSLVDIKYLWTEGELSLEFNADEVADLIKALFAESTHRRNAIAAIKGQRSSGGGR